MLWVLNETVLLSPQNLGQNCENIDKFTLKNFVYLNLWYQQMTEVVTSS